MLDSIKRYFGTQLDSDRPSSDSAGEDERLQIATCALLLEVGHADEDFSADEVEAIRQIVSRRFSLDEAQAAELMQLADSERTQSTDLYQFTRLISENYTRREKLLVLESLWKVVYSDGRLEAREDALLHKLCTLLGLNHKDLIALKLRARGD